MDQLADSIKTKSLTMALEPLTEQVLEISSLTSRDIEKRTNLSEILHHFSEGLQSTAQNFSATLIQKFRSVNPSGDYLNVTRNLIKAAEEAAVSSLSIANNEALLETFQEKVANLLELILQIILKWDSELIYALHQNINDLRKPLIGLSKTQFLHEVLSLYKEFSKQLVEFSEQLRPRTSDLVDRKIQNEFWIALSCLQRLAASFTQIVKNIARYPLSRHIRISKEFVVKELLFLLDELDRLLDIDAPTEESKHAASFVSSVDDVLDVLEKSHFDDENLEWKIHVILQHSMTVSKFSDAENRIQITTNCQRVLTEFRSLQTALHGGENSPADIPLAVDILRDFIELLEQSVNHSLLRMMIENLSASTDPLRNLVVRCSAKLESGGRRDTADLQQHVKQFDTTTERVLQTGFFALASTGDFSKIQVIRSALKILECLEAEIIPAVYYCYLNPSDQAAQCHLQFLWRSFYDNSINLQTSLDSIADPIAFCHIAEKILTERVCVLRANLYTQDASFLEEVCRQIIATGRRCSGLLHQFNWTAAKANQIYLKEITTALEEFRGAFSLTLDNISELQAHRSLLKRAEIFLKYLMKCIDVARRLQDSELAESTRDSTLRGIETVHATALAFPDNVSSLPVDKTRERNATSRSKIGHSLHRKIRPPTNDSFNVVNDESLSEMTRLATTTQPWRTRSTNTFLSKDFSMDSTDTESNVQSKENPETFDLTDILEELTSLDGTLTSNSSNESARITSVLDSYSLATSTHVNTPQRLNDLQIVAQRLAVLRQKLAKENPQNMFSG